MFGRSLSTAREEFALVAVIGSGERQGKGSLGGEGIMMRARGCFLWVLCLGAACAVGQVADEPLQTEPYNKHVDRHLGHDHAYPDRGAILRDAPRGSTV